MARQEHIFDTGAVNILLNIVKRLLDIDFPI